MINKRKLLMPVYLLLSFSMSFAFARDINNTSTFIHPALTQSLYSPDGFLPKNLSQHMPASWVLGAMRHAIWVSVEGKGDGLTEHSPLGYIQEAIDQAVPGTIIFVKAGYYRESLQIKNNAQSGTNEKPILLVSIDGLGKAVVDPESESSTLDAHRVSNWGVIGFQFIGRGDIYSGDISPVKVGATSMKRGEPSYNWWLAGNYISGQGRDGSKFYNSRNIFLLGNTYHGNWGQEAHDNVSVGVTDTLGQDNQFAFNTLLGTTHYSALTLKYGTNNYLIFNNEVRIQPNLQMTSESFVHAAIRLGGNGSIESFYDNIPFNEEPDFYPLTANKVNVLYNRFVGNYGRAVEVYGAHDCEVNNNDFSLVGNGHPFAGGDAEISLNAIGESFNYVKSKNNTISHNQVSSTYDDSRSLLRLFRGGERYVLQDNRSTLKITRPIGSRHVQPLLENFISQLKNKFSQSM